MDPKAASLESQPCSSGVKGGDHFSLILGPAAWWFCVQAAQGSGLPGTSLTAVRLCTQGAF